MTEGASGTAARGGAAARTRFRRILVVCIGNVCRSPMGAALLARRIAARGQDVVVESAGIAALVGRPADPIAVELMRERGIDVSGHRARQLTDALVTAADLVLVMEQRHVRAIEAAFPHARGRVHRIGRWGGFDVPDPHGGTRAAFERALAGIERGVRDLERALG